VAGSGGGLGQKTEMQIPHSARDNKGSDARHTEAVPSQGIPRKKDKIA